MQDGLYESLITQELDAELQKLGPTGVSRGAIDAADQPHVLARHVYEATLRALEAVRGPEERVNLVNDLVERLGHASTDVLSPATQLLRLAPPAELGRASYPDVRPGTPLAEAALLTNTHGEPNLGGELRAEIDTSDEVDLLCAFVNWHGLRLLEPQLTRLRERQAPLRVITTTYLGATEGA